jgi:hypothetical protein
MLMQPEETYTHDMRTGCFFRRWRNQHDKAGRNVSLLILSHYRNTRPACHAACPVGMSAAK